MSRRYALRRLLEHGGLTYREIVEITGWPQRSLDSALRKLLDNGVLQASGRRMKYVYALAGGGA